MPAFASALVSDSLIISKKDLRRAISWVSWCVRGRRELIGSVKSKGRFLGKDWLSIKVLGMVTTQFDSWDWVIHR